jgi:DNA-binding MarR family transcriptional regulator
LARERYFVVVNVAESEIVDHELDAPPWRRFESTLMATSKAIRHAYDLRLSANGLNLSEACLLALVAEVGPITQTNAAARVGMSRAPAGAIIDALCERGLLRRTEDQADRRVWLLTVTSSGEELAQRIADLDATLRSELREGLSRAERRQLASALIRINENLVRVIRQSHSD